MDPTKAQELLSTTFAQEYRSNKETMLDYVCDCVLRNFSFAECSSTCLAFWKQLPWKKMPKANNKLSTAIILSLYYNSRDNHQTTTIFVNKIKPFTFFTMYYNSRDNHLTTTIFVNKIKPFTFFTMLSSQTINF